MGEKCKKCGKALEQYYHDCGDHFSAGPAPGSGWRYKDCTCNESIEETIDYNHEWAPGLTIHAGEYTNGKLSGSIFMADFENNLVEIDCGGGIFWRGTSHEFCTQWERI